MIWWGTLCYGNSPEAERDEEVGERGDWWAFFSPTLPSLSCPSGVGLRGTAPATCTSCTVMNGWGSEGVAMTGTLARAVMQTPLFSGHVCTLFHCLLLLGWCLREKACFAYIDLKCVVLLRLIHVCVRWIFFCFGGSMRKIQLLCNHICYCHKHGEILLPASLYSQVWAVSVLSHVIFIFKWVSCDGLAWFFVSNKPSILVYWNLNWEKLSFV